MKNILFLLSVIFTLNTFSQNLIYSNDTVFLSASFSDVDYDAQVVGGDLFVYTAENRTMTVIDVFENSSFETTFPDSINTLYDYAIVSFDDDRLPEFILRTFNVNGEAIYYVADDNGDILFAIDTPDVLLTNFKNDAQYFEETRFGSIFVSYKRLSAGFQVYASNPSVVTSTKTLERQASTFNVYPNPSDNEIIITGEVGEEIIITKADGTLIVSFLLKETSQIYSITSLNKGVYIVTKEGASTKFVKE